MAHAILHQRQRKVDGGRIVAEIADYRAVYGLVADVLSEGVQATVKPEIRATVEALAALYQGTPVTTHALAGRLGLDQHSASRRVAVAKRNGWIVNQETRRGQPAQLVPGDPLPAERPVLPDPDSLQALPPPEGWEGGHIPSGSRAPLHHAPGQAAPASVNDPTPQPQTDPDDPDREVFDL